MFLEYPIVHLKNGLVVANFSSPHSFEFDDRSVLAGCHEERSRYLQLDKISQSKKDATGKFWIVWCEYYLTHAIKQEVERMQKDEIDIILAPSIVRGLLLQEKNCPVEKVYSCKSVDRISKVISSTEFIVGDVL